MRERPLGNAFGSAFSCGGNQISGAATNQCWKYNSHHGTWTAEDDMPTSRSNAASVTINDGVRLKYVLYTTTVRSLL